MSRPADGENSRTPDVDDLAEERVTRILPRSPLVPAATAPLPQDGLQDAAQRAAADVDPGATGSAVHSSHVKGTGRKVVVFLMGSLLGVALTGGAAYLWVNRPDESPEKAAKPGNPGDAARPPAVAIAAPLPNEKGAAGIDGDRRKEPVQAAPKAAPKPVPDLSSVQVAITRVIGAPFASGDTVTLEYQLLNPTNKNVPVPLYKTRQALGHYQFWVEYLDMDGLIPGIRPNIARKAKLYAQGGSIVPYDKDTFEAGATHLLQERFTTGGFRPGRYKYHLEWHSAPSGALTDKKEVIVELR